ncbi:phosphatidate cytidylyltransferase [Candidatus Woesearchaeota archaeon]|nr:phosphatidate cytidylyltransferase [Candidatus Woesearchaeota archaeon]
MSWRKKLKNFFNEYEFRRKSVHLLVGIVFVFIINLDHYIIIEQLEIILVAALFLSLILSIYTKYRRPKLIISFLELFDKPNDLEKFPAKGMVFYIIGILASIALFDRATASASILILAFGDPAAHLIGRYYGKRKIIINPKKLLEGTIAGIFFGTLAASLFVPFPIAFFGAAFGMMAEAFELEVLHLDDNFFIPFVSGLVMTLIEALL